jgi:uridine kinase
VQHHQAHGGNGRPGPACCSFSGHLICCIFADPRLTDYELLLENIRGLRAGKDVEVPIYDFKQSKRTGYTRVPVPKSRVVIVEGIYALSSRIR